MDSPPHFDAYRADEGRSKVITHCWEPTRSEGLQNRARRPRPDRLTDDERVDDALKRLSDPAEIVRLSLGDLRDLSAHTLSRFRGLLGESLRAYIAQKKVGSL